MLKDGLGMAYFDNAVTTYPKPDVVYSSMNDFQKIKDASTGRGNYEEAVFIESLIAKTRELLKDLQHCPAKRSSSLPRLRLP